MCGLIPGMVAASGLMQYQAGKQETDAQVASYRAQAAAAQQNANIENRKQEQIADNYASQQEALRSRQRLAEGAQRAATGSAGLNFAGSAMDILGSSYDAYQQDRMNLLTNQRQDNYSSRITESNYINQANAANTAASTAKSIGRTNGLATILGTAASVYGAAQPWKNAGGAAAGNTASNTGYTLTTPQMWSNPSAPTLGRFGNRWTFGSGNSRHTVSGLTW